MSLFSYRRARRHVAFTSLYASEGAEDMDRVLSTVPLKVTSEVNSKLLDPYTEREVKEALF